MLNVIFLKNAAVEFFLSMPEVRYLNHDISKNWSRYILKSKIYITSANFLKIQKTSFDRKMAFEAKMVYVLAEIECNYAHLTCI